MGVNPKIATIRKIKAFLSVAIVGGFVLSSCTSHNRPLLEQIDATATYTVSRIVEKVRCEMQTAILAHAKLGFGIKGDVVKVGIYTISEIESLDGEKNSNNRSIAKLTSDLDKIKPRLKELESILYQARIEKNAAKTAEELLTKPEEKSPKNTDEILQIKNHNFKLKRARFETFGSEEQAKKEYYAVVNSAKNLDKKISKLESKNSTASGKIAKLKSANKKYYKYLLTGASTNFLFDIEESNVGRVTADKTWPVSHGSATVGTDFGGPEPGKTLIRKSTQTIKLAANFLEILGLNCPDSDKDSIQSKKTTNKSPDIYPIRGEVGVAKFVDQYIRIIGKHGENGTNEVFNDKIVFTTELVAGINPSIKLTPIPGASINIAAILRSGRKDIHTVVFNIKRGPTSTLALATD